jgi:ankyrin repeat protein
MHNLLY